MKRFETTVWGMIRAAGDGRETAIGDFVTRYRPVVVRFARLSGLSHADAEDVAQEVFLRVFDDRVLAKADPARGRFRSLLVAVTRHVMAHRRERAAARKRGGGREPFSLDAAGFPLEEAVARDERDADFDREWVAELLARALARLKAENPRYYEAIEGFLIEERPQRELARALGRKEGDIRNHVARGRQKLARLLREEVARYASSPGELADEIAYVTSFLG